MGTRVVIIGGVAGGASAAARLRRLDESAEIIILERGSYVSFANCGLPYYVGKVIKDRANLELMTPALFRERFNIDVRVNEEAIRINREQKSVEVRDTKQGTKYTLKYDMLVLSPGAGPILPAIPGIKDVPLFTLRTIPDTEAIDNYITTHGCRDAVVVGGGYIGLEMAENLRERGLAVTVIEALDQVMTPLDREMAQLVHQELLLNGVDLVLGDGVNAFRKGTDGRARVVTKLGREISADIIVLAIGVRPESDLAKAAGLELGPKGHIIVDATLQTSDPSIFAVGDAIQVRDRVTGAPTAIPLAGPANKQGRAVADTIAGRPTPYEGSWGTAVLKVFDLTVAVVGMNEKGARATSLSYDKIYLHPNNHAGYYPNAQPISMKIIFEVPSGRLLGAQVVGGPGAEKRVDVIATAMHYGGKVTDLANLQLAYAPPFGSAKDPINMAGYIASNVLNDNLPTWHWTDIAQEKTAKTFLLDVRTLEEYRCGHIEGAVNIPDTELRERLAEVPRDRPIRVYCQVGFRGYLSQRLLVNHGYSDVRNLSGGYKTYEMATATLDDVRKMCALPQAVTTERAIGRPADDQIAQGGLIKVDATGLTCPGPLNALIRTVQQMPKGGIAEITASDPAFLSSVTVWTQLTDGVENLGIRKDRGNIIATVRRTKEKLILAVEEEPEAEITTRIPSVKKGRVKPAGEDPVSEISPNELNERLVANDGPAVIVDVRPVREIQTSGGAIPGSKLIELGTLVKNPGKLNEYKEREIVLACASGMRSLMAARALAQSGFRDVRSLRGGASTWIRMGFKTERV